MLAWSNYCIFIIPSDGFHEYSFILGYHVIWPSSHPLPPSFLFHMFTEQLLLDEMETEIHKSAAHFPNTGAIRHIHAVIPELCATALATESGCPLAEMQGHLGAGGGGAGGMCNWNRVPIKRRLHWEALGRETWASVEGLKAQGMLKTRLGGGSSES